MRRPWGVRSIVVAFAGIGLMWIGPGCTGRVIDRSATHEMRFGPEPDPGEGGSRGGDNTAGRGGRGGQGSPPATTNPPTGNPPTSNPPVTMNPPPLPGPLPVPSGPSFGSAPVDFSASRTEGVVPLAVFVRPTDGWKFSDLEATRFEWSVNGQPFFVGFNAARVLEEPGAYEISVKATRGGSMVAQGKVTIVAREFTGRTIHVAAPPAGNDTNPGTENAPMGTVDKALATAFGAAGPARVLLRRGDTFRSNGKATAAKAGPYRIGAYGTGARPIVNTIEEFLYATSNDIVVADLDLRGPGRGNASESRGGVDLQGDHSMILRTSASRYANALAFYGSNRRARFLVDSTVSDSIVYGVTTWGHETALLNNTFERMTIEHLLRIFYMRSGLIAGNRFVSGAVDKHQLKLHADTTMPTPSGRVLIADNSFEQPGRVGWMVSIGPENIEEREKVAEVILERNTWRGDNGIHTGIQSRGADEIVLRNNSFLSISNAIGAGHGVPGFSTWNGWRIYNNSYYSPANGEVQFVSFEAGSRILLHNNVAHAPNAIPHSVPLDFTGMVASQVKDSHNVWGFRTDLLARAGNRLMSAEQWKGTGQGLQSLESNPLFTDPAAGDLRLQPTSPARGNALPLEGAYEDHESVTRPRAAMNRGAFE